MSANGSTAIDCGGVFRATGAALAATAGDETAGNLVHALAGTAAEARESERIGGGGNAVPRPGPDAQQRPPDHRPQRPWNDARFIQKTLPEKVTGVAAEQLVSAVAGECDGNGAARQQ